PGAGPAPRPADRGAARRARVRAGGPGVPPRAVHAVPAAFDVPVDADAYPPGLPDPPGPGRRLAGGRGAGRTRGRGPGAPSADPAPTAHVHADPHARRLPPRPGAVDREG